MKQNRIDFITLGCSKNLVDSEQLMHQLEINGYEVTHDAPEVKGPIVVVNTCGFIGDAKEESINTILQLGIRKSQGELEKLYVMGCLSERYREELMTLIPEVDKYYGKYDWKTLLEDLGKEYFPMRSRERRLTTPSHYAYLKISEGCDRHCSYCAIPLITGRHRSRPMEDILLEVKELVSRGVKEFQVIAQELTYYGMDLYGERMIARLVSAMADIPGVEWIRLHYAYPTQFPLDLLDVMRQRPNVCKYLDIALQHISDKMLGVMRRHITARETRDFITLVRKAVPGIHLRTTLMVGHPGELEKDFEQLVEFAKWARFERMGAFAYSAEDGTYSASHFEDTVTREEKEDRLARLMRVQQRISAEIQQEKVGREMRVIIDRLEGDYYVGRTEFDSPEVDPEVLLAVKENPGVEIGHFYTAHIDSADDFDLYAHVIQQP